MPKGWQNSLLVKYICLVNNEWTIECFHRDASQSHYLLHLFLLDIPLKKCLMFLVKLLNSSYLHNFLYLAFSSVEIKFLTLLFILQSIKSCLLFQTCWNCQCNNNIFRWIKCFLHCHQSHCTLWHLFGRLVETTVFFWKVLKPLAWQSNVIKDL